MTRPRPQTGFTLVEMLVSLFIFALLSAAGVALLSYSAKAQGFASARLDDVAAVRRMSALLTSDLAQATGRLPRDDMGRAHPAFDGQAASMELVRGGWDNLDGAPRASVQKVEYRLAGGRLERIAYPYIDGAAAMPPLVLLDDIRALHLRYRDKDGKWRERWDPTRPTELPRAVELVLDSETGTIRHLFLVGTGS